MKKIPPMFGDNIDREWIYMLEDKLYYPHGRDEKMIRHCDFQEVVEEWTKLKELIEENEEKTYRTAKKRTTPKEMRCKG